MFETTMECSNVEDDVLFGVCSPQKASIKIVVMKGNVLAVAAVRHMESTQMMIMKTALRIQY